MHLLPKLIGRLTVFAKEGDQRLSEGVGKDELGSHNQDLKRVSAPPHAHVMMGGGSPSASGP